MRKRGKTAVKKLSSVADFLASPSPPQKGVANTRKKSNGSSSSPVKSFNFNLNSPATNSGTRCGSRKKSSPKLKSEVSSSIYELKEMASSQLESIKRQVERSHSDLVKELDSSNSRLHKRLKMQSQACQQLMDVTDKEFKKLSESITKSCEAMKASYDEFNLEAQTSGACVHKTFIPEKVQSFEKAIDSLRNRYGIFCTPA